jgi:N-acetylneuraminic acid mutarotase
VLDFRRSKQNHQPHLKLRIKPLLPIITSLAMFTGVIAATKISGWQTVTPENTCTARQETSAATVDEVLYLIGGRGSKPVEAYDPKSNLWTKKSTPAPLDFHHFAAVAVGKRIAVFGALIGGFPKEQPVPNLWWYDTASDTWEKGPEIPEDRRRGTAGCVLHGDKLYLVGGNTNGHFNGFVPWLDSLDLKTGEWTRLPDAPHARDHFQAALVDGKIYAAGGRRTHAETKNTFNLTVPEVDVYDIATGKWSTLESPILTPRAGAPTVVRDGRVIVIGGESGVGKGIHGEVEALVATTGKWESLPPMGEPRHSGGADFIGNDLYYVAGNAGRGGGKESSTMEKLSWPVGETKE